MEISINFINIEKKTQATVNNIVLQSSDKYDIIQQFGMDYEMTSSYADHNQGYLEGMYYKNSGIYFYFQGKRGLVQIDIKPNSNANITLINRKLMVMGDSIVEFGKPNWYNSGLDKFENKYRVRIFTIFPFKNKKDENERQEIWFMTSQYFNSIEEYSKKQQYSQNHGFDDENIIHSPIEKISIRDYWGVVPY